jgi:hypothetical protein
MEALKPGEIRQVGNYYVRDFKGYHRSRYGKTGPWRFYISGFDGTSAGQCGRCYVLLSSGSTECVPIDASDRITIHGRKYGPKHWDH